MSAAQMRLLTAKLAPKDVASLKKLMLRPGFVDEWSSLDARAAAFAKVLLSKQHATPSEAFKLFLSYDPEAVLWLGFTSKDKTVQERYNNFLKVWPEARQRIPHALMTEMRITPDLPAYTDLVQKLFLQLIDGHLATPEEMRAFLEPYSPPAPPPQTTIKRPRARRGEARLKERVFEDDEEEKEEDLEDEEGLGGANHHEVSTGDDDLEIEPVIAKSRLNLDEEEAEEEDELEGDEEQEHEDRAPAAKKTAAKASVGKSQPKQPAPAVSKPAAKPPVSLKLVEPHKKVSAPPHKAEPEKANLNAAVKKASVPAAGKPARHAPAAKAPAKKTAKAPVKKLAKAPAKASSKAPHKPVAKSHHAKSLGAKATTASVKKAAAVGSKKSQPKPAAKPAGKFPKKR
jgi:tRNA nucleotidyltransferase (CCA-adding enzyme)